MTDERPDPGWTSTSDATTSGTTQTASAGSTAQPLAFCQDCGRPLSTETIRTVGTGVFCEPCLQLRLAGVVPGSASYRRGYTGAAGSGLPPIMDQATGTLPPAPGEPKPALAGFLGLIPGVGAMYNGQVAKGFAHIAIFAVLVSFSEHVSDVFGWLVAGWIVYQVFDAVHTARARRDGLPLPNTFGLNDIGDRIGFGRGIHEQPFAGPTTPAGTSATPPPHPSGWQAAPVPPPPVASAPSPTPAPEPADPARSAPGAVNAAPYGNWAGYVPPQAFGGPAIPYAPANGQPSGPADLPNLPASASIPTGAIVLIVLGALFLFANVLPNWHLRGRWMTPLVLGILAGVMFARRMAMQQQLRASDRDMPYPHRLLLFRGPLFLALLTVLFLLQALEIATIGMTWPVMIILAGVFLLMERSSAILQPPSGPATSSPFGPAGWSSPVPPPSPAPGEPGTGPATFAGESRESEQRP